MEPQMTEPPESEERIKRLYRQAIQAFTFNDFRALLDEGLPADLREPGGKNALSRKGLDPATVQLFLERGAAHSATDKDGRTPMHIHADPQILWSLKRAGADADARDKSGWTPLHHAIKAADLLPPDAAEALLNMGADVNAQTDGLRQTAMHLDERLDLTNAELLVRNGFNINLRNLNGKPAWYAWVTHNYRAHEHRETRKQWVRWFLDRGADLEQILKQEGDTPIWVGVQDPVLAEAFAEFPGTPLNMAQISTITAVAVREIYEKEYQRRVKAGVTEMARKIPARQAPPGTLDGLIQPEQPAERQHRNALNRKPAVNTAGPNTAEPHINTEMRKHGNTETGDHGAAAQNSSDTTPPKRTWLPNRKIQEKLLASEKDPYRIAGYIKAGFTPSDDMFFAGKPLIHHAKNPRIAKIFLEHGLSPNTRDLEGQTPMFRALHPETVSALYEHGADPKIQDKKGNNVLHNAFDSIWHRIKGWEEMCMVHHRNGVEINQANQKGRTPVSNMEWEDDDGWFERVELALEMGADLEIKDHEGTPAWVHMLQLNTGGFKLSRKELSGEAIRWLLQRTGIDPNTPVGTERRPAWSLAYTEDEARAFAEDPRTRLDPAWIAKIPRFSARNLLEKAMESRQDNETQNPAIPVEHTKTRHGKNNGTTLENAPTMEEDQAFTLTQRGSTMSNNNKKTNCRRLKKST